jgi:histidinol-phosphate aminotransferase
VYELNSKLDDRINALVRPEIRQLSAYPVPDAGGLIKLDAMENPYAWPGELAETWLAALRSAQVNRYPDPGARRLKERLRRVMGVPEEADIILGNGSDELIQLILLTLAAPGRVVLAPEPTFVMYRILALAAGLGYEGVPLGREDFGLDRRLMLEAIERYRPTVVFLAYPNNPTGNLHARRDIEAILGASPGLVVVDEAYTPFAEESFLGDLPSHENLLVMRTVSKMGLAGLRLGWMAGSPAWIAELDKLRLPYNINVLTQLSAEFALEHVDVLDGQTARIRQDREALYAALDAMEGVRVWPSRANFLLFQVAHGQSAAVHASLKQAGVLVKNLHGSSPLLDDCLRVTVGKPDESQAFLAALRGALGEGTS